MDKTNLTEAQVHKLRSQGLLTEEEFVYRAGDLVVAENPITGQKRVVGQTSAILSENNKRVLKG